MLRILILLALFIQFSEAKALDFGIEGRVFEIAEENMLELIKNKLQMMKASGELDEKNKEMQDKVVQYVNRPKEVKGIINTIEPRGYEYDPTYIVQEDIADQDGRVFVPAGRKVNPLEYRPLTTKLLFINGDEKEQVDWSIEESKKGKVKIILVKGNILDLMKERKVRLYFDQAGVLTIKFGIRQVPAIIEQKDLKLLIKEMRVK